MSNPEETATQAIKRLSREIADLRRLRSNLPAMILQPFAEDALKSIREAAANLAQPGPPVAAPAELPKPGQTIVVYTPTEVGEEIKACLGATPENPYIWGVCRWYDLNNDGVVDINDVVAMQKQVDLVTVTAIPVGAGSPLEFEVLAMTRSGRLVRVKPSQIISVGRPTAPAAVAGMPTPFKSGARVRDKTTGKTGFITELAEDKVVVALDEGGSVTRTLTELETI